MDSLMGASTRWVCDHHRAPVDLLCPLVFDDTDGKHIALPVHRSTDAVAYLP